VVFAHSFWRSTFGADKAIVGKPIHLGDQVCTVTGVMPPGFAFLPPDNPVSMWITMPRPIRPSEFAVGVIARLRPGVSLPTAQAEISLLHHRIHEHDLWGAKAEPVIYDLHEEFTWLTGRNLRLTFIVLFAAVNFVILICCVNVANLLLARAVGREREMAIRAALGSARSRLLRQLLTENLLLAAVATAVGAGLAAGAVQYFQIAHPVDLPPGANLALNTPVLIFTSSLGLLTALVFGLIPAFKASKIDLNTVLKTSGKTSSQGIRQRRFGNALVIAEVTFTAALLTGAGLLLETLNRFSSTPLGFKPNGLVTASVSLPPRTYEQPERRGQFFRQLDTQLTQLSGVESVAFSSKRPIDGGGAVDIIEIEGHPKPNLDRSFDTFGQAVSSGYFQVMQTPLLAGRFFERLDNQHSQPVAIVNQAFARKYFPNEDPVGKYIRPFTDSQTPDPWIKVVGVVGDEKRTTVYQEMAWADSPVIFRPLDQEPNATYMIIRTALSNNTISLSSKIRQTISRIDPGVPVEDVQTVDAVESKALAYPRFRAMLIGGFAMLALVLAAVGLLGVLSHSVAQRTHEIGVRMALGAQHTGVLIMILREGLVLTVTGLAFGISLALLFGRYLAALLYGVQPADPSLIAGIALVLILAAFIAIYIPARRASRVDPTVALRYE
jgi:predicted permease